MWRWWWRGEANGVMRSIRHQIYRMAKHCKTLFMFPNKNLYWTVFCRLLTWAKQLWLHIQQGPQLLELHENFINSSKFLSPFLKDVIQYLHFSYTSRSKIKNKIFLHLAVIIALNSLKSTWLSPFTSAFNDFMEKERDLLISVTSIIISWISSSVKWTPRLAMTVLISLLLANPLRSLSKTAQGREISFITFWMSLLRGDTAGLSLSQGRKYFLQKTQKESDRWFELLTVNCNNLNVKFDRTI